MRFWLQQRKAAKRPRAAEMRARRHLVLMDRGFHLEADPCYCPIGEDHDEEGRA